MQFPAGDHLRVKQLLMARQVGPIKITGTIDGITFYRMDGVYYARMKSSLTAKKVKTHPNFALTRMYANWLGEASKMASQVYRALPEEERKYEMFCKLKTLAHKRVKEGAGREAILKELEDLLMAIRILYNVRHSFAPLCVSFAGFPAVGGKEAQRNLSATVFPAFCLLPSTLHPFPPKGRDVINTRGLLVKEKAGYYIYAHPPACKRPRPIFYEKAHTAYGSLSCLV